MSVIITDQPNSIEFLYSTGERKILDKDNINIKEENNIFSKWVYVSNSKGFIQTAENDVIKIKYSEVTSPALISNQELIDLILLYKASSGYNMGSVVITDGTRTVTLEPNGSLPVTLQDQTTPLVIAPFSLLEESTTLSAAVTLYDTTITVTSATGISVGKLITLFDPTSIRFSIALCTAVNASVITLDRPIDFAYPSGSYVDVGDINVNSTGTLAAPILYGIRNNGGQTPPPGISLAFDITRLMFSCTTATAVDLAKFADLTALTNGISVRKRDGEVYNIFNVKSNSDLACIMYDWTPFSADNPVQGQHGFSARFTFGGQNKLGSVIRLEIDEDLELLVQDDLSSITSLRVVAEGSIVQP